MSLHAFLGAIEVGIIYGIIALGVFLTYRVLNFPDLSVESTFPLGGAIASVLLINGHDPWLALIIAFIGGGIGGSLTAFLSVHCRVLNLLAGILTMIAVYSINLRIMGKPNISLLGEHTVFSDWLPDLSTKVSEPLLLAVITTVLVVALSLLLRTEIGLALRATGENPAMLRAQGGNPNFYIYLGLILSNALVALSGGLFAYASGFADITTGVGTIVYGLAAVIVGQALIPSRKIWLMLLACIFGAIIYRLFIALVLSNKIFGLLPSDLYLVTAVLVVIALVAPQIKNTLRPAAPTKNR